MPDLEPETRAVLRRWESSSGPLAIRARVVLLVAGGLRDAEISRRLGVSRQTVGTWRHRWQTSGLDGLEQRPRTGRPVTVDEGEVVSRALLAPGSSGATRAVARELGLSHATVAAVRRRWRLNPDESPAPQVPTRPPLPCAEVWVMGLYVDPLRAVLLIGTRPPAAAAVADTPIGQDVLDGLDRALVAAHDAPAPSLTMSPDADASGRDLAGYLAAAAESHPDIALHAVMLWDREEAPPAAGPHGRSVTWHRPPARSSWRSFVGAMAALDSTRHPESSRRVYLDLVAALERYGRPAPVSWLRETVAGRLRGEPAAHGPAQPAQSASGVNQIDLGSFNECVVIEAVRLAGTITRGEIAHRTGLTQQSVSRIARSLLDRGILIEDAQRRGTSGKPRTPVRLRGSAAHALGMHIDPEVITAVVIDLDGAIVCTRSRPVAPDTEPGEFVEQVAELGRRTLEQAQGAVRDDGFLGVGVAVPGPVDIASGTVLAPPLMSAWHDLPLQYLLQERFPCPVIIEKDSTAAAAGSAGPAGTAGPGTSRTSTSVRESAPVSISTVTSTGESARTRVSSGSSARSRSAGSTRRAGRRSCPSATRRSRCRISRCAAAWTGRTPATARSRPRRRPVTRPRPRRPAVARAVGQGALGLVDLLDIDLLVLGGPFFTDDVAGFYLEEISRMVNDFPTARRLRRVEVEPSVLSAEAAAVGAASTIFHATFTPRLRGREGQ